MLSLNLQHHKINRIFFSTTTLYQINKQYCLLVFGLDFSLHFHKFQMLQVILSIYSIVYKIFILFYKHLSWLLFYSFLLLQLHLLHRFILIVGLIFKILKILLVQLIHGNCCMYCFLIKLATNTYFDFNMTFFSIHIKLKLYNITKQHALSLFLL